jgi:hypothetical protein
MMMTVMRLLMIARASRARIVSVATGALQAIGWLDKAETRKKAQFDKSP